MASVQTTNPPTTQPTSRRAKYRGATIFDLDPPAALSVLPTTPISHALMSAYERDYTHLTVLSESKKLLGYVSAPALRTALERAQVKEQDPVKKGMVRFARGKSYTVITMETPLEDLEAFFEGEGSETGEKQDFAVVTDAARRFVLGVATKSDLEEFVRRRPSI